MKSNLKILSIIINFIIVFNSIRGDEMNVNIKLDGEWKYKIDFEKEGIKKNWFKNQNLNYDGTLKVPGFFEEQIGKEHDGWVWYFKEFEFNVETQKNLALVCNAIDDDAKVWLNSEFVGEHQGYSESFYFDITRQLKSGKNFLAILVIDHGGPGGIYKSLFIKNYTDEFDLLKTEFSQLNARTSPDWLNEGIIYEIFPRSFSKKGDFKSITKRLKDLKDLGVTILWIMPIHPIGKEKRKGSLGSPYSVKDYYEVNPEFGTKDDFKRLVKEAHRLGFRVIIDMVLNHSAWDNKLIRKYPEWYTKDKNGNIISPNSDWTDVADFNYDNPELRKYMINVLKYWIKEFDIDGFRFDVSELVPLDFWEEARKELEKLKPQFWLSEGTLPEHHLQAFDMTYSWNVYDLFLPLLNGKIKPSAIIKTLQKEKYVFPKGSLRMRFNENHDKLRAAQIFQDDGAFITSAIVFTIPGVPLVHAGQEVGEKKFSSLFEKTEIKWGNLDENEFYKFFKNIIKFRQKNNFITSGELEEVEIDEKRLAYIIKANGHGVFCLFNFGEDFQIDLNFVNQLSGKSLDLNNLVGRKFKIDEERMGRPANKILSFEKLGFVLIEFE